MGVSVAELELFKERIAEGEKKLVTQVAEWVVNQNAQSGKRQTQDGKEIEITIGPIDQSHSKNKRRRVEVLDSQGIRTTWGFDLDSETGKIASQPLAVIDRSGEVVEFKDRQSRHEANLLAAQNVFKELATSTPLK